MSAGRSDWCLYPAQPNRCGEHQRQRNVWILETARVWGSALTTFVLQQTPFRPCRLLAWQLYSPGKPASAEAGRQPVAGPKASAPPGATMVAVWQPVLVSAEWCSIGRGT